MARSFGDLVAASVGVSPEPEVLDFELEPDDKFIVIASDGVWEFLSNERVFSSNNPEINFKRSCIWLSRISLRIHRKRLVIGWLKNRFFFGRR